MLFDIKTYLVDDILVKVDRASMGVSLEAREPFLDHRIIEFSLSLPLSFKYKNKQGKYVIRKILHKYIPKNLIDRPKHGFAVPIYDWFKRDLKYLYLEYLNPEKIQREGYFNHYDC